MIFQQYYLECLSQASYLIGDESTGTAVVVDPRRDIDEYLADAGAHGLSIVGVINTHFHADFVAGHLELAEATGAWIGYGHRAETDYPIRRFAHGDHLSLGEVDLEVLETPGHTWESISLVVRQAGSNEPAAVLTGDTLFVGDVGRPDLAASVGASPDELARALYHSIHEVLLRLPADSLVYPAHGAGSACGKNISTELHSTIGQQSDLNPSVQPMSEDEFVRTIRSGQPAIPGYFAVDAVLNRSDRALLRGAAELPALSPEQVRAEFADGVVVVDARSPEEFAKQHLRSSINIGIDGRFAETAGMVLGADTPTLLIAPSRRAAEAAMRLGRIGFDQVVGYVEDADTLFAQLSDLVSTSHRLTVDEFEREQAQANVTVLDVRNPGERELGAIPGSRHIPLAELVSRHTELDDANQLVVHCASGWRSSVAASVLQQLGHEHTSDLLGGYQQWLQHPATPVS